MPLIKVVLSKKLQQALTALDELQNRFNEKLDGYQIPANGTTNKVRVALVTASASVEYGESVRMLCRAGNSMPAQALLRPLQEAWINLAYYLTDSDDTRLHVATVDDVRQIKDTAKLLKDYLVKNKRERLGRFTVKKLEKVIEAKNEELKETIKNVPVKRHAEFGKDIKLPKLYERAAVYDASQKYRSPKNSAYFGYLIVYRLLSGDVHFGLASLADWAEFKPGEINLNKAETQENAQRVVYTAFSLLADIITLTLQELGLTDKKFNTWCNKTAKAIAPNESEAFANISV